MNPYVLHTAITTRDGDPITDFIDEIVEKKERSQRKETLATVARIEARLELERALKRGPVVMATPTPIIRKPGAQATRNPGRIHPVPLKDGGNRIVGTAARMMLIIAAAMISVATLLALA